MSRKLFVSLPVVDVARSRKFFDALGFAFNPKFTGGNAACMIINDGIQVMLVSREFYQTLTPKPMGDPMTASNALLALWLDTRAEVDELHRIALANGATNGGDTDDYGFMYQRGFNDPDGHQWALSWIDEAQIPVQEPSAA